MAQAIKKVEETVEQDKTPPEHKARLGAMQLAVWPQENLNAEGQTFTTDSIKLERSWTDKDGNWQSSSILLRQKDVSNTIALLQNYEQRSIKVG